MAEEDLVLREVFPLVTLRPDSALSLLRAVWHVFTRQGGATNIVIYLKLAFGLALLLLRFEYYEETNQGFQVLIYSAIWLIVLSTSIICCTYYAQLLWGVWKGHLEMYPAQCKRFGYMFVLQSMVIMSCLGILSAYALLNIVKKVNEKVESMQFDTLWRCLFYATAFFRIAQRVLAAVFITVVLPISWKWADRLSHFETDKLLQLLPWNVFLFLHRNILLTTFFGKPFNLYYLDIYEDGPHIISIFYRVFAMLWLFALVVYVAYRLNRSDRFTATCHHDPTGQLVTGVVNSLKQLRAYPKNSELVVNSQSRFGFLQCDMLDAFEEEMGEEGSSEEHARQLAMHQELQ